MKITPTSNWTLVGSSFVDTVDQASNSYSVKLVTGVPDRMNNVTYSPWHFWLIMKVK
jgi:hypothetical protein